MARETSLGEDLARQALLDMPDEDTDETDQQPDVQVPQEPATTPVPVLQSGGGGGAQTASWLNDPVVGPGGALVYTEPGTGEGAAQSAPGAIRAFEPGETPRAQPVYEEGTSDLSGIRSRFADELADPEAARLLMASTRAEVGGQGDAARQAYIESVMNRASAENRTLTSVLQDPHYYPEATKSQLGDFVGDDEAQGYQPLINAALNGSNVSNLATGNESGDVRSGGAPVTAAYGGERFVQENWTRGWYKGAVTPAGKIKTGVSEPFGAAPAPPKEAAWLNDPVVSGADLNDRITRAQQNDTQQVAALAQQFQGTTSLPDLVNKLQTPLPGVVPHVQQQLLDQTKAQIAAAGGDVNAGDVWNNFWKKVVGGLQEYEIPAAQMGQYGTANNALTSFFQKTGMNAESAHAFTTQMNMMSAQDREKAIAAVLPAQIPGVTMGGDEPSSNPTYLAHAFDLINDPRFREKQEQDIANLRGQIAQNLDSDPRLKNTGIDTVSKGIASFITDSLAFINPAAYPVTLPMLAAKVSDQMSQQVKAEHPDWSDTQVQRAATYGTLVSVLGQTTALHAFGAVAEPLLNAVESPVARFLGSVGIQAAGGAATMGGGQAAINVLQGRPAGTGVAEAAITGGLLGAAGGAMHVPARESREAVRPQPEETPAPAPVRPPLAPEGLPEEERVYPPPVPVLPAETAPSSPVAQPEVPVPEAESASMKPLGYRAAVLLDNGEVFSGPEHEAALDNARENGSIRVSDATTRFGFVDKQGNFITMDEADELLAQKYRQPAPPAPAPEVKPEGEGTLVPSAIANKYIQQQVKSGELSEVAPGQGFATEDLIKRGEKMGEEQRNQHISNLMNDKGGDPVLQGAAVRAEEHRLRMRSQELTSILNAKPNNVQARIDADNAHADLMDFIKGPLAKLKRNWHGMGMGMQGEHPLDLSTIYGLREQWLQDMAGKPATPAVEAAMQKTASQVKEVNGRTAKTVDDLSKAIAKDKRKLPAIDEVADFMMKEMGVIPCPTL